MKRKDWFGLGAMLLLLALAFFGVLYTYKGDTSSAVVSIVVMAAISGSMLFFSTFFRSKQGAHVKGYQILGYIVFGVYIIFSFIFIMPYSNHFMTLQMNKREIQLSAKERLEQLNEIYEKYKKQCDTRQKNYGDQISNGSYPLTQIFGNGVVFDEAFQENERKTFYNVLIIPYNKGKSSWKSRRNEYFENIVNSWPLFYISSNVYLMDNDIQSRCEELQKGYKVYTKIERYNIDNGSIEPPTFAIEQYEPLSKRFEEVEYGFVGVLVSLVLVIISCFPFVFAMTSNIRESSKKNREIYEIGEML